MAGLNHDPFGKGVFIFSLLVTDFNPRGLIEIYIVFLLSISFIDSFAIILYIGLCLLS